MLVDPLEILGGGVGDFPPRHVGDAESELGDLLEVLELPVLLGLRGLHTAVEDAHVVLGLGVALEGPIVSARGVELDDLRQLLFLLPLHHQRDAPHPM